MTPFPGGAIDGAPRSSASAQEPKNPSDAYAQVAALLHESRRAAPDQLGSFLAAGAGLLGMQDLSVYVSDYEQRRLVPIAGSAQTVSIAMDDTTCGRAFTTASQLDEAAEGGMRLVAGRSQRPHM